MNLLGVSYAAEDGVELNGLFAGHAAARPTVVMFADVMGIGDHIRAQARRVFDLGYAVLVADMYGGARRFTEPAAAFPERQKLVSRPEVLRSRARAAVEALSRLEGADARRVAACGYCFGGQVALELARAEAPILMAFSFHGDLTPLGAPLKSATIEVASYTGAADSLIPATMVEAFRKEVAASGARWRIIVDGKAKHSFTDPASDRFGVAGVGYDADADELSFALFSRMLTLRMS